MTKIVFSFVILFAFIAVGIWLFTRKNETVSEASLDSTLSTPTPTASPILTGSPMIEQSNGLKVQDLKVGTGMEAKTGQILTVHYKGMLPNGTQFDSSYDRNQPFQLILGGGMVIKGWDLGLVGMKVGGKRKLIIPADLAYGEQGNGPIPPGTPITFEVELLSVQAPTKQ